MQSFCSSFYAMLIKTIECTATFKDSTKLKKNWFLRHSNFTNSANRIINLIHVNRKLEMSLVENISKYSYPQRMAGVRWSVSLHTAMTDLSTLSFFNTSEIYKDFFFKAFWFNLILINFRTEFNHIKGKMYITMHINKTYNVH